MDVSGAGALWHDARMTGTSGRAGFVGRERELARVAASLEIAAGGERSTILIAGPGVVGVGRLVDEVVDRVAGMSSPFAVIRARAFAGRSGVPYAPLAPALESFLAGLDDAALGAIVSRAAEPLLRIMPGLRPRFEAAGLLGQRPLQIPNERQVAWTAEAILGVLERASRHAPVLLTIEDVHLADAATREVAVFLARVRRRSRLCVLMSYAPDALSRGHPFLDDLAAIADSQFPPERVEVGPLGQNELAEFVHAFDGGQPSGAVLLLVAERSSGNPLVAEQVLLARRELAGVSLGTSIEELVGARLAIRTTECRRVLRFIAPAAEPLTPTQLAAVAAEYERAVGGLPPRSASGPRRGTADLDADLRAGLDEAIENQFVVNGPDDGLAIANELVAAAIVADLLPAQLRRIHAAMAAAFADRPAVSLEHWRSAHQPDQARSAALDAARDAEGCGSPGDALAALEAAIELGADGDTDRAAGAELLIRAADLSIAAGRPRRALAYLVAAQGRLDERGDRVLVAGVHERLGRVRRALGDHAAAITDHRRAAELVAGASPAERAPIVASFSQALMLDGRFAEAGERAREAVKLARAAGSEARAWEGHALTTLAIVEAWGANAAAAIPLLEQAHGIARELGRVEDAFRAAANLTTALNVLGRREDSIAAAMSALDEVRDDGLEASYGNAIRGNFAAPLFLAGRWAEARDVVRTALEWSLGPEAFAEAAVTLAELEVETASDERAARLLGRLLLELRKAPDPQSEVPASRTAAAFALWRGDVNDAARAAELGWSLVRGGEDWVAVARLAAVYEEVQAAVVADARDRRDLAALAAARANAATTLAAAEAAVRDSGVPAEAPSRQEADAYLATARGYAARVDGRDKPVIWDSVARAWERLDVPYEVAKARWRQSEAALTGNDARSGRVAARKPIREAARIAAELGAAPLAREVRELARRALITLPESAADAVAGAPDDGVPVIDAGIAAAFAEPERRAGNAFGLSAREREVLSLIVDGRTNREIGERLFISQKTVGVHVGNILSKLGASGRVEAAMVAVRLDLVAAR